MYIAVCCSAVPLARMVLDTDTQIAALDVGIVKSIPIAAATIIPIKKGVIAVAAAMPSPNILMSQMNG